MKATNKRITLPESCYVYLPGNEPGNRIGVAKFNERGYYRTNWDLGEYSGQRVRELVDALNLQLGVSHAEREAMHCGSMFGWDTPSSRPEVYEGKAGPVAESYQEIP